MKSRVFIGIILILSFVAAAYIYKNHAGSRYLSQLTDERISFVQNKVPSEVLTWAREQDQVLGVSRPPVAPFRTLPRSLRVPILMYHYVEYVKDKGDTIRQSLCTSPYTLEQQIITLQSAGYTFMTNAELSEVLDGVRPLPEKPILLTFDDGYRDFYTDVYPILKTYNARATVYVISGFIGNRNTMTNEQIQEIAADGLVEIGAHTIRHQWLKGMPLATLADEVIGSKVALESLIGKPVTSFAYPYGVFDVPTIEAVHQAGFTSAVSTVPGINQQQIHRYFLYRLRSGGRIGESLLAWLSSVQDEEVSFLR